MGCGRGIQGRVNQSQQGDMAGLFHLIHHQIPVAHGLHSDLRPRRDLLQIIAEWRSLILNPDIRARRARVGDAGVGGGTDDAEGRLCVVLRDSAEAFGAGLGHARPGSLRQRVFDAAVAIFPTV